MPGITYADMMTPEGLKAVAGYADGIGPNAMMVVMPDGSDTGLVARAHEAGLQVHPWTLRAENMFLPPAFRVGDDPAAHGNFPAFVKAVAATGVDAFFSDFPGLARSALKP
jgi:glycerophosphoryl diester phosphodiesterase